MCSCNPAWPDVSWFTQKQQLQTCVYHSTGTAKHSLVQSLASIQTSFPHFLSSALDGKNLQPQGVRGRWRNTGRHNKSLPWHHYQGIFIFKKCICKNTHTDSSAWPWTRRNAEGSWFLNSWQELIPLPSLSCCQTPKTSSTISTQMVMNVAFFFSQSCQRVCQNQKYLEGERMESRR